MAQREELILDVTAKLDQALRDVAELQKQLDAIAGGTEAKVTANVQGKEDVEALAETTKELDGTEAEVVVGADDQASEALGDIEGSVEGLDGAEAEVEIEADDNATDALEDAQDAVDDLDGTTAEVEVDADTDAAVSGLGDVTSAITDVASQAGIAGTAVAGLGAAVAAIGKIGMQAFEFTGQVEELSLFTGAALEESSKLLAVLDSYTNIDLGRVEGSIGRLADKLAATPDLASQLGINLDAATGPLDLFVQTVDALNSGQLEATERIALGIDLFGRGGLKAVNEIAASIDGTLADAMQGVSEERVISEADLAAADELEAALGEIKDQLAGMAQVIGEKIIPPLKVLLEQLTAGPRDEDVFGLDEMSDAFLHLTENVDGAEDKLNRFIELGGNIDHLVAGTFDLADAQAAVRAGIPLDEFENLIPALEIVDGKLVDVTESASAVPRALDEINASLEALGNQSAAIDQNWRILLKDLEDGEVNTVGAAIAFQNLQEVLGLLPEDMDALVQQKLDEHMEDVAAAEAAAAEEALRLNQAIADLGDTIGDIDTDDLANIGSALTDAFTAADATIDFQSVKEELRGAFAELETTIAEADVEIDWAKVLDTSQDTGLPPEVLSAITNIRDEFQEGITAAFDIGGTGAAQHFLDTFVPTLMEAGGLTEAQVYELLGLPEGGDIAVALKPAVDAEAKADALAILDALVGVDPNNPILAYMRLAVQTGDIPPQIAEIAARILAGEALGVPATLEGVPQADIDAAYALIEGGPPATLQTAADPTGAEGDIEAVEDAPHETTIDADADTAQAAKDLLEETARQRQATIYAIAAITSAKIALDSLKDRRIASILAVAFTAGAEAELNHTARRRDSYIYQHVVSTGGGGTGGGTYPGGQMAPLTVGPAAFGAEDEVGITPLVGATVSSVPSSGVAVVLTAPASVVNNLQVTVQAAVIGNRHEVERTVAKALRSYTRLNGSRN